MKAKLKYGGEELFSEGQSNNWDNIEDTMIINFSKKGTYQTFVQIKNRLVIKTTRGYISIVFTGETPVLKFESYCKDQLVLKVI